MLWGAREERTVSWRSIVERQSAGVPVWELARCLSRVPLAESTLSLGDLRDCLLSTTPEMEPLLLLRLLRGRFEVFNKDARAAIRALIMDAHARTPLELALLLEADRTVGNPEPTQVLAPLANVIEAAESGDNIAALAFMLLESGWELP